MCRTVLQHNADAHDRVTRHWPLLDSLLETLLDRGDEIGRDVVADRVVCKFKSTLADGLHGMRRVAAEAREPLSARAHTF